MRRASFHCLYGSPELEEAEELAEHQVFLPRSQGDFHLVPAMEGGKGRTGKVIFSIVVGGALLATGIGGAVAAGSGGLTGAAFGASTGFLGLSYGTVALMGAGMLLGGINQLLTPTPKVNSEEQKTTSFTFDGPGGVTDEGGPIPLVYGEVITGGVTIASSIIDGLGSTTQADDSKFSGQSGVNTGGARTQFQEIHLQ